MKLRVVYYLNQFFAGIGGEDQADLPPQVRDGLVGPGQVLQQALGDDGEVVATIYCGDNYIHAHQDQALDTILGYVQDCRPDVMVAGPAFNAGRYGLACALVCCALQERLGIPSVTGMSPDNPAVELYRAKTYIVPTASTASDMAVALGKMARLATKLAQHGQLGPAPVEGYIAKGLRLTEVVSEPVGKRAVDMLMARLRDEAVATEWPVPQYGRVTPARPLQNLPSATIALVTSGGIVPKGNPHRLESARATKWVKYNMADVHTLMAQEWESIHGGYDTTNANDEPNRVLPLDMLKALEDERVIGRLFDDVYVTTGNQAGLEYARRFGQEIGQELLAGGVDGVLLVAT